MIPMCRKIAAFCLEFGKNNKTYFVINILVSFNMLKCTCIFIHTVLLEIHIRFHVLFYSNLSFFLPFFHFFFLKESNWKNLGSELGNKRPRGLVPGTGVALQSCTVFLLNT